VWLPWKLGACISAALCAFALASRRSSRPALAHTSAFAGEASLVFALYSLWQYAGAISVMNVDGAMARGEWIWHAERFLHLPSEVSVQQLATHSDTVMRASNYYYLLAHVPTLIVFLFWMYFRHRDRYSHWRNVLAAVTGVSLAIQLVPVAPPRMFTGFGFVDAGRVFGPSVYSALGHSGADQLSAMPSVHVAWALIVGIGVWTSTRSRWRWAAATHSFLTLVVVTVTANHWLFDGIAAAALLGLALAFEAPLSALVAGPQLRISRSRSAALTPQLVDA